MTTAINTTFTINLQNGFVFEWNTEDDSARVIQTNDADENASVDDSAIETEIQKLTGRGGECLAWDGISDGSGLAVCEFRWTELTPAQCAEVVVAAQATAKLFVEEFGEPLDGEETDWDSTAWTEADALIMSFRDSYKLREAGWAIYQPTLEAETERLCA